MKTYLTIIQTDIDDAIDVVSKVDHRSFPLKHVMTKPKLGLWDLYKIKKHLELGYSKLLEDTLCQKQ